MKNFRKLNLTRKEAKKIWINFIKILCFASISALFGMTLAALISLKIVPPYEFLRILMLLLVAVGGGTIIFLTVFISIRYPNLVKNAYAEDKEDGRGDEGTDNLSRD